MTAAEYALFAQDVNEYSPNAEISVCFSLRGVGFFGGQSVDQKMGLSSISR